MLRIRSGQMFLAGVLVLGHASHGLAERILESGFQTEDQERLDDYRLGRNSDFPGLASTYCLEGNVKITKPMPTRETAGVAVNATFDDLSKLIVGEEFAPYLFVNDTARLSWLAEKIYEIAAADSYSTNLFLYNVARGHEEFEPGSLAFTAHTMERIALWTPERMAEYCGKAYVSERQHLALMFAFIKVSFRSKSKQVQFSDKLKAIAAEVTTSEQMRARLDQFLTELVTSGTEHRFYVQISGKLDADGYVNDTIGSNFLIPEFRQTLLDRFAEMYDAVYTKLPQLAQEKAGITTHHGVEFMTPYNDVIAQTAGVTDWSVGYADGQKAAVEKLAPFRTLARNYQNYTTHSASIWGSRDERSLHVYPEGLGAAYKCFYQPESDDCATATANVQHLNTQALRLISRYDEAETRRSRP